MVKSNLTDTINPEKIWQHIQQNRSKLIKRFLWVGIILLVFGISWYVKSQITKKKDNDAKVEITYENLPISIGPINKDDAKFALDEEKGTGHLRDYYISSSYNSCCSGDFQDSYVSLVPLKEVLAQGVRVLDFALYSVNGKIVVGAGGTDSNNIKGTYNALSLTGDNSVFDTINSYAFSHPCPNPSDPLFLHFRIKSKIRPQTFYKKLTEHVKSAFGGRLLPPKYGYEGRVSEKGGVNIAREHILNLMNHVIIICHQENNNFRDTAFEEYVNVSSSGSAYLRSQRNYDIQFTHDPDGLISFNKKNMTLTMPDYSSINNNMNASLHMKYGCQMICMNWSNYDSPMEFYRNVFKDEGSAFVLKPENQRYKVVTIAAPPPQNPNVSYAKKRIDLPMYKKHI